MRRGIWLSIYTIYLAAYLTVCALTCDCVYSCMSGSGCLATYQSYQCQSECMSIPVCLFTLTWLSGARTSIAYSNRHVAVCVLITFHLFVCVCSRVHLDVFVRVRSGLCAFTWFSGSVHRHQSAAASLGHCRSRRVRFHHCRWSGSH